MELVDFFVEAEADVRMCLCNDMTKLHEMSFRGTPAQVREQLLQRAIMTRASMPSSSR